MRRAERRKMKKYKEAYGEEAAQRYKQWVQSGKPGGRGSFDPVANTGEQGTPGTGQVDFNNPQSVVDAQTRYNEEAQRGTTPNVTTDFGSREVVRNEDGSVTVNDKATGANADLIDQSQQGQGTINQAFDQFMQQGMGQGAFNGQQGQQALPQYQDPRQGVQPIGNFRDMQQRTFDDSMATYRENTQEDIGYQRQLLEQQMANEGVSRGSEKYNRAMKEFNTTAMQQSQQAMRGAYRDSHDVANQAQQSQIAGSNAQFGQNYNAQGQQFDQTFQGNDQRFGQNVTGYEMPHKIAGQYMGAQGRYQDPNMGPVQSIAAPQLNLMDFGSGMMGMGQQDRHFNDQLDYNRWAKQGDWNTSRSTAGAGSLGYGQQLGLINARAEAERNNWAYQQGIQGGQVPSGAGFGDVAGAFSGGFAGGAMQGFNRR